MSPQAQAAVAAAASQFAPATDAAAYANHALLHDIIEQAALPPEVLANRLLLGDILDGPGVATPTARPRRRLARRTLKGLQTGERISVGDWRALPGITLGYDEDGDEVIVIDPKRWRKQGLAEFESEDGYDRQGLVYAEIGGTRRFVVCGICFRTGCRFSHWIDE